MSDQHSRASRQDLPSAPPESRKVSVPESMPVPVSKTVSITAAIDSEWPSTEEIDSEWPDEDAAQKLRSPEMPATRALPADLLAQAVAPVTPAAPEPVPDDKPEILRAAEPSSAKLTTPNLVVAPASETPVLPEIVGAERASEPVPRRSSARGLLTALSIAAALGVALWFVQRRAADGDPQPATAQAEAHEAQATEEPRATAQPAPTPAPEPQPSSSAQAESAPVAAAAATQPEPVASGTVQVVINVKPPGARIFHKGKEVGTPPVTIELAPGEKRSFEVGHNGYVTRKLVVDGTKTEILVSLRPDH